MINERGSERWQLTDKADGRTRTLYVPARHAAEVAEVLALCKEARTALKELSSARSVALPWMQSTGTRSATAGARH